MLKSSEVWAVINIVQSEVKHGKGTFFSAINTKMDGSERTWNCRLGVTKYLRGGSLPYSPEEKNFITVFCNKSQMYKQLNVFTISFLKVCGITLIENGIPTQDYLTRIPTVKVMEDLRKSVGL